MKRSETSATSVLFLTAAARLASRLDTVAVRRSGAFVLDTAMHRGTRIVMTIPGRAASDATPTIDVLDERGLLRTHELEPSAARLFYAVMTLGRSRHFARKRHGAPLLNGALTALARWHDARVEPTMRILSFPTAARVIALAGDVPDEITGETTRADRPGPRAQTTTALSSSA